MAAPEELPQGSAPKEPPDPMIGGRVGNCRLEKRLGPGWYEARRMTDDEPVHLRLVPPEQADDAAAVERFFLEADAARLVDHPNVLKVLDSGSSDNKLFMVQEYVRGQERLEDVMAREGRVSFDKATRIAREVAGALGAIHAAGVVHRDLRPEHVLIDAKGQVRVTGFSRAEVQGRPAVPYEAPEEIATPEGDTGVSADLYMLGVLYYRLLSARHPYSNANGTLEGPRPLVQAYPQVDVRAIPIVDRLVARDPAARFPSAEEAAAAMDEAIRAARPGLSESQQKKVIADGRAIVARKTRAGLAWPIAIVALVLLAAGGAMAPVRGDLVEGVRSLQRDHVALATAAVGALELLAGLAILRRDLRRSGRAIAVSLFLLAGGAAAFGGGLLWDGSRAALVEPAALLSAGATLAVLGASLCMNLEEGDRLPVAQVLLLVVGAGLWFLGATEGRPLPVLKAVGGHLGFGLPMTLVPLVVLGLGLAMITGRQLAVGTRWGGIAALGLAGALLLVLGSATLGGTLEGPERWLPALTSALGRRAAEAEASGVLGWAALSSVAIGAGLLSGGLAQAGERR